VNTFTFQNKGFQIPANSEFRSMNDSSLKYLVQLTAWDNISGFRGEDFLKSTNQKQELPVVAMFVNGSGRNEDSL
jgi:hypothetical protein